MAKETYVRQVDDAVANSIDISWGNGKLGGNQKNSIRNAVKEALQGEEKNPEVIDISRKSQKTKEEQAAWRAGIIEQIENNLKASGGRSAGENLGSDVEI